MRENITGVLGKSQSGSQGMLSILPSGLLAIGPWATESPIAILEFEFGVGLESRAPASSPLYKQP